MYSLYIWVHMAEYWPYQVTLIFSPVLIFWNACFLKCPHGLKYYFISIFVMLNVFVLCIHIFHDIRKRVCQLTHHDFMLELKIVVKIIENINVNARHNICFVLCVCLKIQRVHVSRSHFKNLKGLFGLFPLRQPIITPIR